MPWRRALVLLCFLMPLFAAFPLLAQVPVVGMRFTGDATQSFIAIVKRLPPSGVTGFSSTGANPDYTDILRRGSSDTDWKGFSSNIQGHAVDVTVHRGQLMVLMSDGSWRAVYEGSSNSGDALPSQSPVKLMMLAGEGPVLLGYAQDAGSAGRLVQREGNEWKDQGPAPELPMPAVADLVVFADRVFLAASMGDGTLRVWRSAMLMPPAAQPLTRPATRPTTRLTTLVPATQPVAWELIGTIAPGYQVAGIRLVPLGKDLAKDVGVWADPGTTDGGVIYRWRGGEKWERAFSLGPINGDLAASLGTLRFYSERGASNEPGTTRPVVNPKATPVEPQMYEYAVGYDGKFVGNPIFVDIGQSAKLVRDLGELIVGMATAGLMLAIILWWRKREHWTVEVVTASQALPLAPVERRLLAGIIDVLPWLGMLAYLFYRNEIVVEIPPFRTRESVLLLLYAYATVLTHTTICEVIFGRTIGMVIAGLRVTNMQGHRATPGQILLRNFSRAVDMVLVAPYLAVFTSPLNQSLGDAAAGTLVLTRDSANMPPTSPPEGKSGKSPS